MIHELWWIITLVYIVGGICLHVREVLRRQ
jgi:hypothetical protein